MQDVDFFADETCNHHVAACSSLPTRCLRARRTRPPPQQRPLGVTEACLFTKQLVQDRLLQWISLFLPSVPPQNAVCRMPVATQAVSETPASAPVPPALSHMNHEPIWVAETPARATDTARSVTNNGAPAEFKSSYSVAGCAVVTHGQRRGQRARPGLCWHNTRPPRPG